LAARLAPLTGRLQRPYADPQPQLPSAAATWISRQGFTELASPY